MAASLWTEADITALSAAIASGVFSVSYTGPPSRTVTYHSLTQMRSLLASMVLDVREPATVRFVKHNQGWGR